MDETPMSTRTGSDEELTTDEIFQLLDSARTLGVTSFTFTGGEPFLRKDLTTLIAHANGLGLRTHVISNGSLLTAEIAEQVVNSGLTTMDISVDGPAAIHDSIRRVPGLFEKVRQGLSRLDESRRNAGVDTPHVALACSVSALNQTHLTPLVTLAEEFHAPLNVSPVFYTKPSQVARTAEMIQVGGVKPEDRNVNEDILQVDIPAMAKEIAMARALSSTKHVPFTCRLESERDIERRFLEPGYAEDNKCLSPWYALRVNPSGKVYPCSLDILMGNVRNESLEQIWNGKVYREFRIKLRKVGLFPSCAKCCTLNKRNLLSRLLPRL